MEKLSLRDFFSRFDKNRLDNLILELEKAITNDTPKKDKTIQETFREIHSLKGIASYTRFQSLTDLLYTLEDALGVIHRNAHQIKEIKDPKIFDALLKGADVVDALTARYLNNPHFDMRDSDDILRPYMRTLATVKEMSSDPDRPATHTDFDSAGTMLNQKIKTIRCDDVPSYHGKRGEARFDPLQSTFLKHGEPVRRIDRDYIDACIDQRRYSLYMVMRIDRGGCNQSLPVVNDFIRVVKVALDVLSKNQVA